MSAEELLEKNHPGELMRKRHPAKGDSSVGALEHAWIERERPTDREAEVAAGAPSLLEEPSERLARREISFAVEDAQIGILGRPPQDRVVIGHLDRLQPCVPRQEALVVGDV